MRKTSPLFLGLSLATTFVTMAAAQDVNPSAVKPPKYIQIVVEYTKPGKGGLAHDKSASSIPTGRPGVRRSPNLPPRPQPTPQRPNSNAPKEPLTDQQPPHRVGAFLCWPPR
jgi:hypothetical protein